MKVLQATSSSISNFSNNKFRKRFHSNKRKINEHFKKNHRYSPYKIFNFKFYFCGRNNHVKTDCYFYKRMNENQRTTQAAQLTDTLMIGSRETILES